jgi:hypothetical protein
MTEDFAFGMVIGTALGSILMGIFMYIHTVPKQDNRNVEK